MVPVRTAGQGRAGAPVLGPGAGHPARHLRLACAVARGALGNNEPSTHTVPRTRAVFSRCVGCLVSSALLSLGRLFSLLMPLSWLGIETQDVGGAEVHCS